MNRLLPQVSRLPRRRRHPNRTAILLGMLWAAPITLFGLLLATPIILLGGRCRWMRGATPALLVHGPLAGHLLVRHPYGAMTAMALGHVVIVDRRRLTPRVLSHELAHVRQAARWGLLFPFAYLAASAWAVLHGRDAYWHNRFEIAAREAEKRR